MIWLRYFDAVIENLGEQTNTMGYTDDTRV
jgi:hypothetical protein